MACPRTLAWLGLAVLIGACGKSPPTSTPATPAKSSAIKIGFFVKLPDVRYVV